jgi:hypothetical protein
MRSRRLLTLGYNNEPIWVRLFVQKIGETWSAMVVADGVNPPAPAELKGLGFLADTREEAEQLVLACLGAVVSQN